MAQGFSPAENGYVEIVNPALPALSAEAASHIRFVQREGECEPSDPIFVERFFPAEHHGQILLHAEDAELLVEEYTTHIGRLAIRTPVIYERHIEAAEQGYRIRQIAEYVPHRPLVRFDELDKGSVLDEDVPVLAGIITKVTNYLKPIPRGQHCKYLRDISRIAQYGVAEDGEAVLPDTDELMDRAIDYNMSWDGFNLLSAISLLPLDQRDAAVDAFVKSGIPLSG